MRGRPPTGAAMSPAERSRRYRQAKTLRDAAPSREAGTMVSGSEARVTAPMMTPGSADYPRMLYRADGRTLVAETPEEHKTLMAEGWETMPLAVHRQQPVTQHGVLGTDLAATLREVIEQVLDERDLSDVVTLAQ